MNVNDLSPLSVAGRIDMVRGRLDAASCDALVITDRSNIRWCTGFTGSSGVLVVDPSNAVLITDSRYRDQAPAQLDRADCDVSIEISQRSIPSAAAHLTGVHRVGLEAESVTWSDQQSWSGALVNPLVATTRIVLTLRSVKSQPEIARIEAAAEIVDQSLADAVDMIEPGISEREVSLAIDDGMRRRGADGPAYDTIVASGDHSAMPHATPGSRLLRGGDLLIIDAGALVDGYRSDMTRTFVVGGLPASAQAQEILDLVTCAQSAGVNRVGPDVNAGDVDRACREIIDEAGYGEQFGHGTGHGVGLDIHELPAVTKGNADILQPGNVLTVEPGIYIAGFGGVRIEDTVVVTSKGSRSLTRFPKNPTP